MSCDQCNQSFQITSQSTEMTIEIGTVIGRALKGGEIIALSGPLGSGKTHLIKGITGGLGAVEITCVNSPTFVIVNEYAGPDMRLDVFHIDAYRIDSLEQFEMLGFDEFCYAESVVLIEWADKVAPALDGTNPVKITLMHVDKKSRNIKIVGACPYVLKALRTGYNQL